MIHVQINKQRLMNNRNIWDLYNLQTRYNYIQLPRSAKLRIKMTHHFSLEIYKLAKLFHVCIIIFIQWEVGHLRSMTLSNMVLLCNIIIEKCFFFFFFKISIERERERERERDSYVVQVIQRQGRNKEATQLRVIVWCPKCYCYFAVARCGLTFRTGKKLHHHVKQNILDNDLHHHHHHHLFYPFVSFLLPSLYL